MRERIRAIIERVMATRPARAFRRYGEAAGPLLAQGLSWQAVFAAFAGLWLAFAVAGFWLREDTPLRAALLDAIQAAVPGLLDTGEGGAVRLDQLLSIGVLGWTGAIAAVGLAWTAIGWLGSGRAAVRAIVGLPSGAGNFLVLKLRDAGITLGLGLAVLLSAALSLGSTALLGWVFDWVGVDERSWLASAATRAAGLVCAFIIDLLVLIVFFRYVAGVRAPWRTLLGTSALGALALGVLKALGAILLGGASSNPLLASFAVIIGLLIWFNLICQAILITAAWLAESPALRASRVVETTAHPRDDLAM